MKSTPSSHSSSALTHLAHSGIHGIAEKIGQAAKNVEGSAEHDRWALSMSLGVLN